MHYYKFVKYVNSDELTKLLKTYNLEPIRIDTVEEEVFIYYSSALSTTQQLDLQTAVDSHDPNKPMIPRAVTPRQIRMALVKSGISITNIENTIDSLEEPQKSEAKIAWEYSNEFQRNNPLILAFAPMFNLTEEQLDQIFILANTL